MIEETGRVVNVDSEGIWVETLKQSACASCAARNGCGQKLLANAGSDKRFIVNVSNPESFTVNIDDSVLIGVEEGAFIKATLYVYLLPLVALILGALIGSAIFQQEGFIILTAVLFFGASFLITRTVSKALFKSCEFQPVLLKVV